MGKNKADSRYVTTGANPARATAMVELRRSNAAGKHATGANRERTRTDKVRAEIERSRKGE